MDSLEIDSKETIKMTKKGAIDKLKNYTGKINNHS